MRHAIPLMGTGRGAYLWDFYKWPGLRDLQDKIKNRDMGRLEIEAILESSASLLEEAEGAGDGKIGPIRVCHIDGYLKLCQGLGGWNENTSKKPWEMDEEERARMGRREEQKTRI